MVSKGRLNFRAVQMSEWGGTFVIALSGTLDLWAVGRKSDWGRKLCRVARRRRGRAKNEALFPGRVPHVRPSVHGPKMTGRSPSQRFYSYRRLRSTARVPTYAVKALE